MIDDPGGWDVFFEDRDTLFLVVYLCCAKLLAFGESVSDIVIWGISKMGGSWDQIQHRTNAGYEQAQEIIARLDAIAP